MKPVEIPQLKDKDGVDLLLQSSQLLWRESSLERLIGRYVRLANDHYGLKKFKCFHLAKNAKGRIDWHHEDLKLSNIPEFSGELSDAIHRELSKQNLKKEEYRQGVNPYHLDGIDFYFTLLGDPLTEWFILLWTNDPRFDNTDRENTLIYTDFLVRQLQSGCTWFCRLDRTQALLHRDDLTGLYNIRYLDLALDAEIRRVQRFQTSFCLLFIDLDNFKQVNDQYGHLAGSYTLKQVADVLRDASREVDSVIRYGGDEFIILLLGANPSTGLLAGERIRRQIERNKFRIDGVNKHINLTASIGVAAFPDHATSKEQLLKLADQKMYEGKRAGKNKVVIFSESQDQ